MTENQSNRDSIIDNKSNRKRQKKQWTSENKKERQKTKFEKMRPIEREVVIVFDKTRNQNIRIQRSETGEQPV